MSDSIYTTRHISHDEAQEALSRFEASHFHKTDKEHARISIPADPDRDDDLILGAYIRQQASSDKAYQEVIEAAKQHEREYATFDSHTETKCPLCLAVRRLAQGGGE